MKKDKKYSDRLMRLAKYVETKVQPKAFNMDSICDLNCAEPDYVYDPKKKVWNPFDCGSTHCMVGASPLCFPELGLKYDFTNQLIKNHKNRAWNDRAWYGITFKEWQYLFGTDDPEWFSRSDETPKQAAKRLKEFVKNGGIPKKYQDNDLD